MPIHPTTVSKVMRELANRRSKEQRKGGRPRQADRCPCGKYTKHTAERRKHRCENIL